MKLKALALAGLLVAASGCATLPPPTPAADSTWIRPREAVMLAADAAPQGVPGVFALEVMATGTQRDILYLNSETDYRDQRNISIDIPPAVARELHSRLGAHPRDALKGMHILVEGEARRVRINFLANGQPTGSYYYQTHVKVRDASQITIRPRRLQNP